MDSKLYIGVDPGTKGAVAVIQVTPDFLVDTIFVASTESNARLTRFHTFLGANAGRIASIVCENERAMPRDSARSSFALARETQKIIALISNALQYHPTIPVGFIHPQDWQAILAHRFPFLVDRTKIPNAKRRMELYLKLILTPPDFRDLHKAAHDAVGLAICAALKCDEKIITQAESKLTV